MLQIATLASTLLTTADRRAICPSPNWQAPGDLRDSGNRARICYRAIGFALPRPAISGIRVYERYFYLNQ